VDLHTSILILIRGEGTRVFPSPHQTDHSTGLWTVADAYRMALSAQRRYDLTGSVEEMALRDAYIEQAQKQLAGHGWSGAAIILKEKTRVRVQKS